MKTVRVAPLVVARSPLVEATRARQRREAEDHLIRLRARVLALEAELEQDAHHAHDAAKESDG